MLNVETRDWITKRIAKRHGDPRDWPSYRLVPPSVRKRGVHGIPLGRAMELGLGYGPIMGGMPEGRLGHIGFAKEVTFGTAVAAARYFQFISESLYSLVGEVTPQNIVNVFDQGPTYLGLREHKGKIKMNVFPDFIGSLLVGMWGADTGPVTVTGGTLTASASGGSLATGTYYVRVSPIYGDATGISAAAGTYIGVLGPSSTEQSVSVTGPTGSIGVAAPALSGGALTPSGYAIFYGTSTGNETVFIVTGTTSGTIATITTMTVGSGVVSSAGVGPVSGSYLHVFDPRNTNWGTNSIVQPYTFEVHRDLGSGNTFQFQGTAIEKWMLNWGVRGVSEIMECELDVIAKTYALITATTATFDNLTPFLWNQCKISLADATYQTIQAIKFDVDNGIEGKPYINQSNEVTSIVAKSPRVVGVSGTMLADITQWQNYTGRVQKDLNIIFTGPVIPAATNATYQLMMDTPLFQYKGYDIGISSPQEVMVNFQGLAKYNFGATTQPAPGSPMRIALANDVTTAY